jgi:hypothetical protein
VETPELRALLLYLGAEHITNRDLPHKDKTYDLIEQHFAIQYQKLVDELQVSSCISEATLLC